MENSKPFSGHLRMRTVPVDLRKAKPRVRNPFEEPNAAQSSLTMPMEVLKRKPDSLKYFREYTAYHGRSPFSQAVHAALDASSVYTMLRALGSKIRAVCRFTSYSIEQWLDKADLFEETTVAINSAFYFFVDVQITTVDFGSDKLGGRCASSVSDAHERLRLFPNVKAMLGDSFRLFPKLVRENRGKRIGLFIDGPKGLDAVDQCMKTLRSSADVYYCLFHDVLPDGFDWGTSKHEIYYFLKTWGRAVVTSTCCTGAWLGRFGLQFGLNSSMGVVAGTGLIPLGVKGDNRTE